MPLAKLAVNETGETSVRKLWNPCKRTCL